MCWFFCKVILLLEHAIYWFYFEPKNIFDGFYNYFLVTNVINRWHEQKYNCHYYVQVSRFENQVKDFTKSRSSNATVGVFGAELVKLDRLYYESFHSAQSIFSSLSEVPILPFYFKLIWTRIFLPIKTEKYRSSWHWAVCGLSSAWISGAGNPDKWPSMIKFEFKIFNF